MQKYYTILIFSLLLAATFSCRNNEKREVNNFPTSTQSADSSSKMFAELQFVEDFFDFGSLVQGEVVSTSFRFRNIGNIPLVIKHVIPSCGCTKTKVSKEVLSPNEEAFLEVNFESAGWRGIQYKDVTLRTNDSISEKSVTIKANVVVK